MDEKAKEQGNPTEEEMKWGEKVGKGGGLGGGGEGLWLQRLLYQASVRNFYAQSRIDGKQHHELAFCWLAEQTSQLSLVQH